MIYLVIFLTDKLFKHLIISIPLHYINNSGFIFGINVNPLLLNGILLLSIVIFFLLFRRIKLIKTEYKYIFLGFIMNISDRIIWGGVIDYLNIFNILVINLADVIIMIGIIKIIYKIYLSEKHFFKN